jgi:23S rRNA (uracil1939-C5)-methyltransferase
VRVLRPSAQRVAPRCPHYGVCGGCSMQHLDADAQAAVKQRILEDALRHIGKLRADRILPAIHGPAWGYRYRARLGVRLVPSKGGLRVGFHERRSSYIVDMRTCPVLPPAISALLPRLRTLLAGLSIADRLPQVEIAVGEESTVFVFRNYALPDFGLRLAFAPNEFTQVNHAMNRSLLRRAMSLLAPKAGERIADMFCGLGNFSLPIAALGAEVVGIEGADPLVQRAYMNAVANGLQSRATFRVANLFKVTAESLAELGRFDKMLIDPPREGAFDLVKALPHALDDMAPQRIVYVSCSPATLARDLAVLVNDKGYRLRGPRTSSLRGAGIANMFPQTSHVESIALIERSVLAGLLVERADRFVLGVYRAGDQIHARIMARAVAADLVLQRIDLALARRDCGVALAAQGDPLLQRAFRREQRRRLRGEGAQRGCVAAGDAFQRALCEFALVLGGDLFGACARQAGGGIGELGPRAFARAESAPRDLRLRFERVHLHVRERKRLLREQSLHIGEAEAVEQLTAACGEACTGTFGLRLRGGVAAVRLEVEERRAQLQCGDRVAVVEILLR